MNKTNGFRLVVLAVIAVVGLVFADSGAALAQAPEGMSEAAPMKEARAGHTAIKFPGALVMVCGGTAGGTSLKTCENYDVKAGTWASAPSMSAGRAYYAVTYLQDLQIFFHPCGTSTPDPRSGHTSADMYSYDQQTQKWKWQQIPPSQRGHAFFGTNSVMFLNHPQQGQATVYVPLVGPGTDVEVLTMLLTQTGGGSDVSWVDGAAIPHARDRHSGVPLEDGKVLVVGGYAAEAEIYDPKADTWTAAGSLNINRGRQAAVLLDDDRVLVCGGDLPDHSLLVGTCELWDPKDPGVWTRAGDMNSARVDFSMVALANGMVLAAGGQDGTGKPVVSAEEFWDPDTTLWTRAAQLKTPRAEPTVTTLGTGQVLICGGKDGSGAALASCELYQPQQLCAPGSTKCDGKAAFVCDSTGMFFMKVADCLNGCQDGSCIGENCSPGARRCKDAVTKETVEECAATGDHWVHVETCDEGCEYDAATAWCTGTARPDAGIPDTGHDTGKPDAGCVPDCEDAVCGQGDGCGGICENGACPEGQVCDPVIFMCGEPKPDAGAPVVDSGTPIPQTDGGAGGGGSAQPAGNGGTDSGGGCSCAVLGL
ncbi:MAG: hypothetical protein HY897_17340 [Deltaproteobacteria bacterium]|nr:hypothetical protein [Deltaproteobacteria bacterium]